MKNASMTIAMFLVFMAAAVQAQENLARVQKIGDKEIYMMNEPVRSYEFVDDVRTGVKWVSLLTRGIVNEHVNDKTNQFVRKAVRKLEKNGQTFDAIVYRGGKRAEAIRFTEDADEADSGLARVIPVNGISVYVMAEPVQEYAVVDQVKNNVNLIPFITYGIVNNSIERDIQTLTRRAASREVNDVALIYQTGRRADLVTFTE